MSFVKADVTTWEPRQEWDMVLANIFFDVLSLSFPKIYSATKPGGIIMVSGILRTHKEECLNSGARAGIVWDDVLLNGKKWVTAIGHRPAT